MSDITKKYVDYAGLQEYDSQIKSVISTDFVGATSSSDGAAGRVPAPTSGDENKYLRGDGTWSTVGGSGGGSVTGVKGDAESTYRDGNVNITAANIGLANVNNTSDADKPVSTAAQLEFDALRYTGALNFIPYHAVKNQTIAGVSIVNNYDGSFMIDGTAESGIEINFLTGDAFTDPSIYTSKATMNFRNFIYEYGVGKRWKMSLNATGIVPSGFSVAVYFYYESTHGGMGWVVSEDTPQLVYTTDANMALYKYITMSMRISPGAVFNELVVKPSLTPNTSETTYIQGAMSNIMITDYLLTKTLPTFKGTSTEWNALDDQIKRAYKLVILSEDD